MKTGFRVKPYKHDRLKFVVPGKVAGKWQRRYFATKGEATTYAQQQNTILLNEGRNGIVQCSKPTALKEMEALAVLGIADKQEIVAEYGRPEHELLLAGKFQWFVTDECKALRWPDTQAQAGNF